MPATLAIGDFARATHLTVKALRHYHRIGLLVPADVDDASGYRYYSTGQIATAQVIRRLRDLEMPLDEIAGVLSTDDLSVRNQLMASHLDRLERALDDTQRAVRSLRDLLESSTPPSIELRTAPAVRAAAVTAVVDASAFGPWFQGALGELDATIAAHGVPPAGPAAGIYETAVFADGRGEATVFIPLDSPVTAVGRVHMIEVPSAELAVTVHAGSHDDIDRAYGALATYVAERAISMEGPVRETYTVGLRETADPRAWSTEIGWPIFHPGVPVAPGAPHIT